MKKIFITVCLILFTVIVKSQPQPTPNINAEICPEENTAIEFVGASGGGYTIPPTSLKGCTIISDIDKNGRAVIKFSDKKETHQFGIYSFGAGQIIGTYTYTKIKTIDGLKPTWPPPIPSVIHPEPPYDDVINIFNDFPPVFPCNTSSFNYAIPVLKYKDSQGNEFGTAMTSYQWLVPKGWKVNGTTSDGVNTIDVGAPSATITSDLISSGELQCRAKNNCDPLNIHNLTKSNWYRIRINRPVLKLSVNSVNPLIVSCGDESNKTFSLENINQFSCVTGFEWQIGSNWLMSDGSQAQPTFPTSTGSLTLKLPGTSAVPGEISVKVFINGVASSTIFTCPVRFVNLNAAPVFSSTNPLSICSASTQSYTVIGGCSPISYTYNLSSSGAVFSANGLTTITTTSSTVNINFPHGDSYSTTLSAQANYPNNISSAVINSVIQFGNSLPTAGYYSNGTYNTLVDEISGSNYVASNTWTVVHASTPVNSIPQWTSVGGYGYSWQIDSYNELNINVQSGGYAAFQMDINGECSGISKVYIFETNDSYSYYSVSPNPATTNVTVYVDDKKLNKLINEKFDNPSIRQIIVRNRFGNAVLQQSFSSQTKKAILNIGSLSTGVYIIQIFDGKKWNSLKLIKN